MSYKETNRKIIVLIVMLIAVIIILISISIIQPDFLKTKNENIISALIGIASGLFTWVIIFIVINKYYNSLNKITLEKLKQIEIDANKILDHLNALQDKNMNLIAFERKSLLGKKYYENLYKNADDIRISGITVDKLVEHLCIGKRNDNHLINQLKNRKNVSVKILCLHPESSVVKILDEQEKTSLDPNPVKNKILKTIGLLEIFSKKYERKLNRGSKLEIVMTKETLNSIITFAGNSKKTEKDVLLMGMLYGHKRGGPLYQIPKSHELELYGDCLDYFDRIFDTAKSEYLLFSWSDDSSKKFKNIINQK